LVATASLFEGLLKLGQPEPLSNFWDVENSSCEQQTHIKLPDFEGKPGCENGGSVSPSWVTACSIRVKFLFFICLSIMFDKVVDI
jgi:hypothetical protein